MGQNFSNFDLYDLATQAAQCAHQNCLASQQNAQIASTSATAAAASAAAAAASAAAAAESAEIAGIYLGPKAIAPTTDNDGGPLQEGMLYYNTVSNVLFVWNGSAWVSTDFNEFTNFTATGTTTARNLVTRFKDVINVKDFGAVGDGIANDFNALESAFIAGINKEVYLPAGIYLVQFSGIGGPVIRSNTKVKGAGIGKTTIILDGSASYFEGFGPSGPNVIVEDLSIEIKVPNGNSSGIAFKWRYDNLKIKSVSIKGDTQWVGGVKTKETNVIVWHSTGNFNNLILEDCVIENHSYAFLRQNSVTSNNENISVTGCLFKNMWRESLGINSPAGSVKNVIFQNNFFDGHNGISGGLANAQFIGLARAENVVVSSNIAKGVVREGMHIEDAIKDIIITNNILELDLSQSASSDGIGVTDSNASGSPSSPTRRVKIQNNIVKNTSVSPAGFGYWLVNDLSGVVPAKDSEITGNTAINCVTGVLAEGDPASVIAIRNNHTVDCTTGYDIRVAPVVFTNNTSTNATTFATASGGGSFLLPDYVDDVAAAAGGIPIGGQYRTGSALKIRVS